MIAHSHGGLVARAHLDRYGADKVARLITLGTPHNGMLETLEALCQGLALLRFNPEQLMSVARGFPSAYELLPLNVQDQYFLWNNTPASPFTTNDWCTDEMKPLLASAQQVTPNIARHLPVPLFALHGTRTPTRTSAEGPADGTSPTAARLTFTTTDDGDGTVPLSSGAAKGITSDAGVQRFAIPFAGHAFLFDDPNTREVIRHILRDDPLPAAYFTSVWEHQLYLPNAQNRLAVELDTFEGDPVPNATVTLTLPTAGVNAQPVAQQANGDYLLTVTMPGAGTQVPYVITAAAPTLPAPFHASGLLVAAAN